MKKEPSMKGGLGMTFTKLDDLLSGCGEFVPLVYYNNGLDLITAQGEDCEIVECPATKLHSVDIGYDGDPVWWRRILGLPKIVSVSIWSGRAHCREYGMDTHPISFDVLLERMMVDPRNDFTWTKREKRRALAFLRHHVFMIDWDKL